MNRTLPRWFLEVFHPEIAKLPLQPPPSTPEEIKKEEDYQKRVRERQDEWEKTSSERIEKHWEKMERL